MDQRDDNTNFLAWIVIVLIVAAVVLVASRFPQGPTNQPTEQVPVNFCGYDPSGC